MLESTLFRYRYRTVDTDMPIFDCVELSVIYLPSNGIEFNQTTRHNCTRVVLSIGSVLQL